jgi:hypothetical protein
MFGTVFDIFVIRFVNIILIFNIKKNIINGMLIGEYFIMIFLRNEIKIINEYNIYQYFI